MPPATVAIIYLRWYTEQKMRLPQIWTGGKDEKVYCLYDRGGAFAAVRLRDRGAGADPGSCRRGRELYSGEGHSLHTAG